MTDVVEAAFRDGAKAERERILKMLREANRIAAGRGHGGRSEAIQTHVADGFRQAIEIIEADPT